LKLNFLFRLLSGSAGFWQEDRNNNNPAIVKYFI